MHNTEVDSFIRWLRETFPVTTGSTEETLELAGKVARQVPSGTVIALDGPLGAGKTQFVKGFCRQCGVPEEEVRSPTFTIVNEYESVQPPIYHLDAYRIDRVEEMYELGYERYLYEAGICLIEWASRVQGVLPEEAIWFRFDHAGSDQRQISWHEERPAEGSD